MKRKRVGATQITQLPMENDEFSRRILVEKSEEHINFSTCEKLACTCALCQKTFSDKNCLKKHIHKIHNVEPDSLLPNNNDKNKAVQFKCRVCKSEFSYKRNLKRHLIKYHSLGLDDEEGGNCFCNVQGCTFRSFFMSALRTHLSEKHGISMIVENKSFSSKTEFDEWKENEEKSNVCLFIKEAGKHTLINGDQRLIYQCHRSGHYSGHGFGKRSFRVKGTCKLGKRCTAGIELTVKAKDNTHEIVYYKTHIWHEPDVTHVNLSASERAYLANKLKEGVSIATILESVKGNHNNDGSNFCTRIQLLKRKDLVNIENTFRLNNTERHIKKQHKKGQKIERENIKRNLNDYGEVVSWAVESSANESEYFTVQSYQIEKCIPSCGVICSLCDICLHMYSCTCHDYLLFGTMCQHIHSVSLSSNLSNTNTKNSPPLNKNDKKKIRNKFRDRQQKQSLVDTESITERKELEISEPSYSNSHSRKEEILMEKRKKLKQKIQMVEKLCSLKLNCITENSIQKILDVLDSVIEIFHEVEMDKQISVATTPTLGDPNQVSVDLFDQMQTPLMTESPISPENMIKEQQPQEDNLFNELSSPDRKLDTFPYYAKNRKRKTDDLITSTIASSTVIPYRSHNFDKINIYATNLNDSSLLDDNYSTFDYNGPIWSASALSTSNSNTPFKWWAT